MTETPARYRHRTPEVDAVQWTGSNAEELRAFAGADFDEIELDDRVEDPDETAAVREADHGTWRGLKPGDWVVKIDGGLYEFSAADFAKQYEATVSSAHADRAELRARIRALALLEAADFLRDAHFRDGLSVQEIGTALRHTVDTADPMVGSLARDGFGLDEIAVMLDALVLPASADRAGVLREAARHLYTALFPAVYADMGQKAAEGVNRAVSELRRMADEVPQAETEADGACGHRSSDGYPCNEPSGHLGYHRNARQGGNEWTSWVGELPLAEEQECCGVEPPDGWPGDCWCTLPSGHEGGHRCEPCSNRHDAPGWADTAPAVGAQQPKEAGL